MINLIVLTIIKSSVVLLAAYIVSSLLVRNSAANRNYIYRLGFLSVLLLPLFSNIMPQWDLLFINLFPVLDTSLTGGIVTTSLASVETAGETSSGLSWLEITMLTWLIGSAIVFIRIIIGKLLTNRINKQAEEVTDPKLTELLKDIENDFQLNQPLIVKISNKTSVPFVTGIFKQTIILPQTFSSWSVEKQKMVLVHETAHIKRNDTVWLLLSSIASVIYWFNPLIWVCRRKMIIDSEIACDNYVLSVGYHAQSYAEHLLNIANNLTENLFVSPLNVSMARKTQLEDRLMFILKKQKRSLKVTPTISMIAVILTVAFLLPLSGMQLFAGETEDKKKDVTIVTVKEKAPTKVTLKEKSPRLVTIVNADDKKNEKEDEKFPKPDEFVELKTMPEMIKMEQPVYPDKEKKKGVQGDVFIKALVKKDGTVHKAMVSKTSGSDLLDHSAAKAAFKNIFSPGIDKNNKPVACWVTYKVTFALSDKEPMK